MAKRRWLKVLAIILVLLTIFVMTAPASLIKDPVADANLPVQLSGYQGQLLNGQVQNVFIKGLNYQNLSWRLRPLSAMSGKFAATLSLADPRAEISLDVALASQEDWHVSDFNGEIELAPIIEIFPMLSFTKPDGNLILTELAATLNNAQFSDSGGTIQWQNASLTFNGQRLPLGLITGQLSDDGDHLYLDFSGDDGIAPSGQFKITPIGAYTAEINIDANALPARMSWMNNMGQLDADGRLAIALKGQL